MKNFILITISLLFLVVSSCQDETQTQSQNLSETITKVSHLSSLVSRVTQQPTYYDNCVDGTSCFCVLLPVSGTIDNQSFTVSTYPDYYTVKTIIEASEDDDDVSHFTFPITIKYQNFQQVVVYNQSQLNTIRANCGAEPEFHEIGCIHFNYPIVINSYNSSTQVATTFTVQDNSQFYNLIAGFSDNQIYSLTYPISMMNSSGQTVVFNNNAELQAGIENVINDCDDNGGTGNGLSSILIDGTWKVSSFLDGNEDETYHYSGYNFTFNSNGTTVAIKNTTSINGTWSIYTDDGNQKLNLSFDGSSLEGLGEDWRLIEYTTTSIRLRHQSGGSGETHYLTFTKN
jgi:hypothetical protein